MFKSEVAVTMFIVVMGEAIMVREMIVMREVVMMIMVRGWKTTMGIAARGWQATRGIMVRNRSGAWGIVDDKAQSIDLAVTLSNGKNGVDTGRLGQRLAARGFPTHNRAVLGKEITLGENVVGDVGKELRPAGQGLQLNALGNLSLLRAVKVHVSEPNVGNQVGDDNLDGSLWGPAKALMGEVLDGQSTLELVAILGLEPCSGPELGLDEALPEDMVKDVFQIQELVVLEFQLDELGSGLLVRPRGNVVSQPELGHSHVGRKGANFERWIGRAHV